MAAQRTQRGTEKKRKSKKKKARTEVSSSSESDSDVSTEKSRESETLVEKYIESSPEATSVTTVTRKSRGPTASPEQDVDTTMTDAQDALPTATTKKARKPKTAPSHEEDVSEARKSKPTTPAQPQEDFSAIYLRKVAAELADDLDKVREAQDFKANSVPMLIHALKQGESMFSAEEKKRVVAAASQ